MREKSARRFSGINICHATSYMGNAVSVGSPAHTNNKPLHYESSKNEKSVLDMQYTKPYSHVIAPPVKGITTAISATHTKYQRANLCPCNVAMLAKAITPCNVIEDNNTQRKVHHHFSAKNICSLLIQSKLFPHDQDCCQR